MLNALLFAVMLSAATLCLGAEAYPSKPVRVLVSVAPGGAADLTARVISQQLSEQLGRLFVVENRAGAGGVIGDGAAAKSAPDGYTLLVSNPAFTILPGFNQALPYDPVRDFTQITQIVRAPFVLVVHPSLGANTLKEFIALAQANPGKFNFSSSGTGGPGHLNGELLKIAAKINIVHIPYKSGGEATTAMLGGQVQIQVTGIPNVLLHVRSARMRALAVTTDGKRLPALPEVPSFSEAGVSGMSVYVWFGLAGPAGMPKEVVNKLHAEVVRALAVPSVRERFIAQDTEPVGSSPEEFSLFIRSELRRWAELIKSAGITPD